MNEQLCSVQRTPQVALKQLSREARTMFWQVKELEEGISDQALRDSLREVSARLAYAHATLDAIARDRTMEAP